MRFFITSLIILFGLMSPSFGEDVKEIKKQKWGYSGLIDQLCIGGYEFVVVCKEYKGHCYFGDQNFQITQIITEEGGGKKC